MANEAAKPMLSAGSEEDRLASLRQAAWQLEDAIAENFGTEEYPREYDARALFFQTLRWRNHYYRALLCFVVLTMFETPTWCDTDSTWEFGDPQQRCLVYGEPTKAFPGGKPIEVMLSGITYLPPGYSLILEVAILSVLFWKLWLERKLQADYFRNLGVQVSMRTHGKNGKYVKLQERDAQGTRRLAANSEFIEKFDVEVVEDGKEEQIELELDDDLGKVRLVKSGTALKTKNGEFLAEIDRKIVLSKSASEGKRLKVQTHKIEYFSSRKLNFCMTMIGLELLDCLYYLVFRPNFRIAFLCRTALFLMLPSVIKLFQCIKKILGEVLTVAVFFVGFLFFFTWVSVMIFNGYDNPPQHFSGFGKAFYGLFVAGVCDEFTDILIESYTAYRWSGILWFLFLLVVHLLFLSLVLDTLCAGYMTSEVHENKEKMREKASKIRAAFAILNAAAFPDGNDKHKIGHDTFMAFLEEYIKSPTCEGGTRVTREYAEIAFSSVDKDNDQLIDEKEFCELCVLTQYSMWKTKKDSCLKDAMPDTWNSATVEAIRNDVSTPDGKFEHVMTSVLFVNFTLVIIETTYDLNKWDEPVWTAWLEFVFSFVYLGECLFKIGVSGWDFYQSSTSNKFDFGTTMLLLSTSVFESLLGGLSTYANILRLFRLLRVVKQLKGLDRVQFMVSTVVKLVFKAQDMLILLSVVIFGFTVVGVQLFGGLLYEENPQLEGSDYHEAKEFVLNFNDFLMAFGLWFVMLLCEYKPSFASAINRTSGIPKAWLLCGLFWAIAVCITFELVKAFTIEVYMDLKKKWDDKAKNGEGTPEVIDAIYQDYELKGYRFWWKCLAVDEGEYADVMTEVEVQVKKVLKGKGQKKRVSEEEGS